MTLIINVQNLQQENGMLLMTKMTQNNVKEIKMMHPCNRYDISLYPCIPVTDIATGTNVAFKNCTPFTRCVTHINDDHVDTAENLDIVMNLYNFLEYSDNYPDTSGSL